MRILHVITSLRTGGAEKLMVDLLPRLKMHGHEVDLLLFDGTATPFRRAAEEAGIKVMDLGCGGSVYSPLRLIRLFPYLRKYDIVHTHNTACQLFAAVSSLVANPVLFTTEHNTSNRRRAWKWYNAIDRWMYSCYRKVICISDKTEANLRNSIDSPDKKIVTINNGIDVNNYASAVPSDLYKEKFGCSTALMQVAGFRHQKDQDTVIHTLTHLPESTHLYLVGDGERRPQLEQLIAELNLEKRVHLLGIRSDVASLLAAADIVIMSSHWEGFGLAAVEGMATGRPVIASDVDGLREVVEGAGVLFPHGDSEALANEILRLENDPELYAAVAGRCRDRARLYDISTMADSYARLYDSINE